MTQELLDLRSSILEGRYDDALAIVHELEGMSKQAIIRNIESFLERLMIHLQDLRNCHRRSRKNDISTRSLTKRLFSIFSDFAQNDNQTY